MKVFISGPVSGPMKEHGPIYVGRKFNECSAMLKGKFRGCETVIPTELCKTSWSWLRCMIVCLKALRKCDAICLMEGHEHSRGSRIEMKFAKVMHMPVLRKIGNSIYK